MFLSNRRKNDTKSSDAPESSGGNLEEVAQAMKNAKNRRMYERYQALYMYLKGYLPEQISDVQNRHVKTVKAHIKAYETGGLAALEMHHSPGAPSRLSEEQLEALIHMIQNHSPSEVGYSSNDRWTLRAIAFCIETEFGCRYSLRGVSKLIQRHGIDLKRKLRQN